MVAARRERLAEAFVEFADTLVADFDVIEFLHRLANRCVELLDVDAVGLMLADGHGHLQVAAASSEQARLMDLFQIQSDQGPCVTCFHTGQPVAYEDLRSLDERWPRLSELASELGLRAQSALPMRLRDDTIGVMNLFRVAGTPLAESDLQVAQALADVATIGLLQERAIRQREVLAEQLQTALLTRVVIEQAKGVLAERFGLEMHAAFNTLRRFARSREIRLGDLAGAVVRGEADMTLLAVLIEADAD